MHFFCTEWGCTTFSQKKSIITNLQISEMELPLHDIVLLKLIYCDYELT
jgi:hypothetical protein